MGSLVGILSGFALGVITWLVTAKTLYGELTIETTGSNNPLLAGNVVSIGVPTVVTIVWSLISPDDYTFEGTRTLNTPEKHSLSETPGVATPPVRIEDQPGTPAEDEKNIGKADVTAANAFPAAEDQVGSSQDLYRAVRLAGLDPEQLQHSVRSSVRVAVPLTFILLIFVPCMAIIPKTFSETGFAAWISIWIAWLFVSAATVIVWPVWESRHGLWVIGRGMYRDLTGGRGAK